MRKAKPKEKLFRLSKVVDGIAIPVHEQHQQFCENWLKHFDHKRAAIEAGFEKNKVHSGAGLKLLKKYHDYLSQRKAKYEVAIAKKIAIDQQDVINELIAIAFANPLDYVMPVEEKDANGNAVTRIRQKPLMELTRAQASAISKVTFNADGTITYELPDLRDKHPALKDIGQHIGMFHAKLIQEHRYNIRHTTLDFKDLDQGKLEHFENLLIDALGERGKRMLGVIDGEYEDIGEER